MTEHENSVSEEKKNSRVGEPSEQDSESQAWNLRQAGPLFSPHLLLRPQPPPCNHNRHLKAWKVTQPFTA